ncbi:hypothetical protein BD779DRAFT_527175 [Infundibulicybe gibba]|nr:hypothetical protein BD779DRAFT_527175 [Infundibulicybe gibba]
MIQRCYHAIFIAGAGQHLSLFIKYTYLSPNVGTAMIFAAWRITRHIPVLGTTTKVEGASSNDTSSPICRTGSLVCKRAGWQNENVSQRSCLWERGMVMAMVTVVVEEARCWAFVTPRLMRLKNRELWACSCIPAVVVFVDMMRSEGAWAVVGFGVLGF